MQDVSEAVERLGQTMERVGLPRMPARVFAFLVADDRPTNTASELASGLGVSPAAISGAVRYLCDTHLVVRERNPTGRGDIFRIRDEDVWATIQTTRLLVIDLVIESVQEAITLLPRGSAGRGRVEDARDYFRFVQEDAHGLDMRWREWRDAHRS